MKAYHIKVYLTPKGIKTEKTLIKVEKENDGCYYFKLQSSFGIGKHKVGSILHIPNVYTKVFDKSIIYESYCFIKDYNKTRLELIKQYKSEINISLIKKNILDVEKEIRINKKRLMDYKKGFNVLLKSIKSKK